MKSTIEPKNSGSKVLTAEEAGDRTGMKPTYIKRKFREGEIPAFKIGKFWRTTEDALDGYIAGLNKGASGNGGFSKDAKDRIRYHAIQRSLNTAPAVIEKLNQDIHHTKAAMQIEDQLKKVALAAKLKKQVTERETKRMRLDEIPQLLDKLADSAYPGMKELANEDPEALEALFAAEVNGGDQAEAGHIAEQVLPPLPTGHEE